MELSIITSNVSADFLNQPGVPSWDERKELYVQTLRSAEPNLIGLQEITPRQYRYIADQFPEFTALTIPVVDPDSTLLTAWRYKYAVHGLPNIPSPYELILFYRTAEFQSLASGHWWLSPTPDRPSIGFGNVAPRAVIWANLLQISSGREFLIFNTHIDHRCTSPMIELCRRRLTEFSSREFPLFLIGDFNFNPTTPEYSLLLSDGWRDIHDISISHEEETTFMFDRLDVLSRGRIDHILYRGDGLVPQFWTRLLSPHPERRISDHDPVHARFRFQ